MNKFKNKVAVVTGGNSGMGYATAQFFAMSGAKVFITGRRKDAVIAAATQIGAMGIVSDQSSLLDTDKLVEHIKNEAGKVDILFINAGINIYSPIASISEHDFDSVMNVNFKGAYFTLSKFIPILNDGASVIFLSSIAATSSAAGGSVYYASKAALNSVAKIAAIELAPRKIRVNIVSPGATETELFSKLGVDGNAIEQMKVSLSAKIPLARLAKAEEIANLVSFLADNDSSAYITGSEFVIDGGIKLG